MMMMMVVMIMTMMTTTTTTKTTMMFITINYNEKDETMLWGNNNWKKNARKLNQKVGAHHHCLSKRQTHVTSPSSAPVVPAINNNPSPLPTTTTAIF